MIFALGGSSLTRLLRRFRPPSPQAVGRRGYGLFWLATKGLTDTPGWVIGTPAFDAAVSQAGVSETIAEIEWSLGGLWNDLAATERVLAALEEERVQAARRLRQVRLPAPAEDLLRELADVPAPGWLLSPSLDGDGELDDLFSPLVSVPALRWELLNGVRQLWSSVLSRQVLRRCAQNDRPLPRMAVVLQPLAPITARDRSGIVYSHSPNPAFPGTMIEAAYGFFAGSPAARYSIVEGRVRFRRSDDLSPADPIPLTTDEALALAHLVAEVERQWGGPLAVEFIWPAGGKAQLIGLQEVNNE